MTSALIRRPAGLALPARHYWTMPSQAQLQADLDADNSAHLRRTYILPGGGSPLTITGDLTLHPGQTLRGQSRDRQGPYGTYIVLSATGRIILDEQTCLDTMHIHQDSAASVDGIFVTETSSGTNSHRFILRDLHMSGGAAGVWAVKLENPAEFLLDNIQLITASNGLRIAATNDYAYNPGDAVCRKVQVRLQSAGTTGIHVAGQQAISAGGAFSTRYPNDIHWFHTYVTAGDQAGWASAGNVGIQIDNCSKSFWYGVNLEELQTNIALNGGLNGGPGTAAVRFFGSWFGGAWAINAGVTDAHFDGKFDNEPTGANIANISINGVRTGLGSSVTQLAMPHIRGPLGGQLLPLETYVTNSSGADIANNRVCYWTAAGTIDLMTSTKAVSLFAGITFGTVSNGTSGYIVSHGIAKVASTGVVAVGDYLVIDPSNAGKVLSTGTAQSTSQATVGVALSGGTSATITMRLLVLPPAVVPVPASSLGGLYLAPGYTYSSGLTWTTAASTLNALLAAPITLANTATATSINVSVTTLGNSGAVVRLGIYADNGTGLPGALVLDAGTIAADGGGTGVKKIVINQALSPGTYWLAAVAQVTATNLVLQVINAPSQPMPYTNLAAGAAASSTHNGVQRTASTSGALPGTFGACTSTGGVPRVMIEV